MSHPACGRATLGCYVLTSNVPDERIRAFHA
jgi:hypothetical protein